MRPGGTLAVTTFTADVWTPMLDQFLAPENIVFSSALLLMLLTPSRAQAPLVVKAAEPIAPNEVRNLPLAARQRPVRQAGARVLRRLEQLGRVFGLLGARRHDVLADADACACPVLVVAGGRDPVVSEDFCRHVAARAPHGTCIVVSGSAHGVALDPAEPFCRILLRFLGAGHR